MGDSILGERDSDFEAESEAVLQIRLQEITAIAKLQEISKSEAFADVLKSSALAPVKAAEQIVTHPVQTVKALPGGINRAARGLFCKSRKTAHRVARRSRKRRKKKTISLPETEARNSTAAGDGDVLSSERFGELALGIDGDGRYVLPGVADYLTWQPGMSDGPLEGLSDKELWLSGEISPQARRELETRGWTVRNRVFRPAPGAWAQPGGSATRPG